VDTATTKTTTTKKKTHPTAIDDLILISCSNISYIWIIKGDKPKATGAMGHGVRHDHTVHNVAKLGKMMTKALCGFWTKKEIKFAKT
jgi:hypothetical protein